MSDRLIMLSAMSFYCIHMVFDTNTSAGT